MRGVESLARVNAFGIDDLINTMRKEGTIKESTKIDMLVAGADVLIDEMRNQIKAMDIWDLGATWWSIKHSNVKNRQGEYYIEVWPAGKRRDDRHPSGERIETVAFIAEYGTAKIPARPFMSTAVRVAEERVADAMMKVWKERDR